MFKNDIVPNSLVLAIPKTDRSAPGRLRTTVRQGKRSTEINNSRNAHGIGAVIDDVGMAKREYCVGNIVDKNLRLA